MRRWVTGLFLLNVAVALATPFLFQERMAVHFGMGGAADGWGPPAVNAAIFSVLGLVLYLTLLGSARLVLHMPARWINLPNKDYWLTPENRPRAAARLAAGMESFGAALFGFLLVTQVLVIEANRAESPRLNEPLFLSALGLFLVYTGWWTIRLMQSFAAPKTGGPDRP